MAYVSLTPQLEEFIQREVKTGRYSSPSEVIREAVRLLEEKKQLHRDRLDELATEVRKGVESGEGAPLDMGEVIGEAERRFRALDPMAAAKARVRPTAAQAAKSVEEQEREAFDEVRAMRQEYAEGRDR